MSTYNIPLEKLDYESIIDMTIVVNSCILHSTSILYNFEYGYYESTPKFIQSL